MSTSLRQSAEQLLRTKPDETPSLPTRDVQVLVRELNVRQAELEIQNEELRNAQQAALEARDRYSELYQAIPIGCLTLDAGRVILEANSAAAAMLEAQGQPLAGKPLVHFVAPEDADACHLHLRQAAAGEKAQQRDLRFRRGDGRLFWADMQATAVLAPGAAAQLQVTLCDIDERKQAEALALRIAAELQSTNAALEDARRAALNVMEDAVEARRETEQASLALQASEQRIQQALRVSHSFTFEWQPATDEVLRSASCETILGLTGDDACSDTGQRYFQRVHPDDRERFIRMLRELRPDADSYTADYRLSRQDGSTVILEETAKADFDAAGTLQRVVGVCTDITARKLAEQRLFETNQRLQALMAAVPVGISFSDDATCRHVSGNPAVRAQFEVAPDDNLSASASDDRAPGRQVQFFSRGRPVADSELPLQRAVAENVTIPPMELEVLLPSGRRWFADVSGAPVRDAQGRVTGGIAVTVDISERKQTEEVLRFLGQCAASGSGEGFFQQLARYLAQTLNMDFVCIDRLEHDQLSAQTLAVFHDGRFEDNVAYALKDTPCGDVVGKRICCFQHNVRMLFPKDAILQELKAECYLGTTLWDAQGKPIGLIAVISREPRENTRQAESILQVAAVRAAGELERLRAEEALTRLNAELEHRVATRTAELASTNRELEAFCYSVSHDLRAPLRSMDGFSQALLEDYGPQLDATGQDFLNRVRSNCQRMARLIDDLLHLSRLARSQMRLQPVDLTALAQAAIAELRQAEPERSVDVRIAPDLVATGDPVLLLAAVGNLLQNAWKFTSRRPDAVIEFGRLPEDGTPPPSIPRPPPSVLSPPSSVLRPPPAAVFFVRDNGVGFDMRFADKLFTPFQRLHAMTDFPGSGIGLATVQRVLHRHGGRVWFDSAPGRGSTFYFMIGAPTCP